MLWNRNEPLAEKRRVLIAVYTDDGALAPATTLFTGTNEILVDKGDGHFVAPLGTLKNTDRPLVIADDVLEAVDQAAETLTFTAHGLLTGDGPIRFTNAGGALPAGIVAATDYWVIFVDANKIAIATSLAFALANTRVNLTSAGSGVNTLVDTASTKRLNDGVFMFEATQPELDYRGDHFGIRISKPGFRDAVVSVDLRDEQQVHSGKAQAGAAGSITLDVAASATNDLYRDCVCIIVGGMGAGQSNTIASYAGGSKVATMARNWAINPDATSEFVIAPAPSGANPSSVATAVWGAIGEGLHSYGNMMRGLVGAFGKTTGYDGGVIEAKSLDGAKTRWTWTVDQTGRLTATPGDWT